MEVARCLKLECVGEGQVILANGNRIRAKIAYLYMKINDEHVFTLVSYDGCEKPLLGFDVMHLLGLQIDTGKKELLKPLRRRRFRNLIFSRSWILGRGRR
jgi:predicted aspartyl protease